MRRNILESYVLPLLALLLNFLAFVSCLRFLFKRQGFYWLIPMAISLALVWVTGTQLLTIVSTIPSAPRPEQTSLVAALAISALWMLCVTTFRYALKKTIAHNKHLDDTWKNYHEARYMEKVALRSYRRQERRYRRNNVPSAYVPAPKAYPEQWIDYFDRR
ncbi:MAG: hypothetical protein ACOX6K_01955 [Sphaerochaetaceae bacterium]|jgi:hypothetical protein